MRQKRSDRPSNINQAQELMRTSLVWDNHACMPLRPDDASFLPQLQDVRAAGVDVISLNAGFGPSGPDEHLAMLESFTEWLNARADDYRIVLTVDDIQDARRDGKLAVLFDVEGMAPLNGGRLDLVEDFRRRGVGWMLIAYNRQNDAGFGCYDEDGGLTGFGREVIAEMKRVGMMICCSHTGFRTAREVIETAGAPVIFSHSNASAVDPHERNIPDWLIDLCAESGGVIGVNGIGAFLGGTASVTRLADHVEHIAARVGAEHVGLGLDFVFDLAELEAFLATMRETFPDDASFRMPVTMIHDQQITELVAELIGRGFDTPSLKLILGGNWMRVASQVWPTRLTRT